MYEIKNKILNFLSIWITPQRYSVAQSIGEELEPTLKAISELEEEGLIKDVKGHVQLSWEHYSTCYAVMVVTYTEGVKNIEAVAGSEVYGVARQYALSNAHGYRVYDYANLSNTMMQLDLHSEDHIWIQRLKRIEQ